MTQYWGGGGHKALFPTNSILYNFKILGGHDHCSAVPVTNVLANDY